MNMDELLNKQKQLMECVPHDVRGGAYLSMKGVKDLIEASLLYLTSLGHKPWRPNPLPEADQYTRLEVMIGKARALRQIHRDASIIMPITLKTLPARRLVSAFGIIEETLEYLEAEELERKGLQSAPLEELTDILFFWLEMVAMSGSSLEQIEQEYHRKWSVNMERYEDGKRGDYSWDKREEGKL